MNNFQIGEATESDDDLAPISAAATTAAAAAAKKKSKRTVAINLPAQANKRRSGDLGLSSTNPHHHQLHQDITDLEEDDHEGGHSHSKKQKTTATAAALVEITGKSSGKSARGSGGLVGADLHQVSSSSFAAASSGTTIEKALTFQMAKQLSIEVAKVEESGGRSEGSRSNPVNPFTLAMVYVSLKQGSRLHDGSQQAL